MNQAREWIEYHVAGPPGTGKTTYLSRQISNAMVEHGRDEIIVASHTRAAAAEIARRDISLDSSQVGTLHALCYRAIGREHEVAEKYIKDWNTENQGYALEMDASNQDEPYAEIGRNITRGDQLLSEMNILRARMVDKRLWPTTVRSFSARWEEWKKINNLIDFTDMLETVYLTFDRWPGNPSIGFFDECQDLDTLQLALVRKMAKKMSHIVMAFDVDQTLYRWKGADPEGIINTSPDGFRSLPKSYRVPRAVHGIAKRWIEQAHKRLAVDYEPRDAEGEVTKINSQYSFPSRVIDAVEKYIADKKSVMLLTSCSYMLSETIKLLRKRGIPFHNPNRTRRGDWNPLRVNRGTSMAGRVLAYLKPDPSVWGDLAHMWTAKDLKIWLDPLRGREILVRGAKSAMEGLDDKAEISVVNLLEWFINESDVERVISNDIAWLREKVKSDKERLLDFPLTIVEKRGGITLREPPLVKVGTIHSVKGDEADVVILFPDVSLEGYKEWRSSHTRDNVIRQFYVGMTRARETLVLCKPSGVCHVGLWSF